MYNIVTIRCVSKVISMVGTQIILLFIYLFFLLRLQIHSLLFIIYYYLAYNCYIRVLTFNLFKF